MLCRMDRKAAIGLLAAGLGGPLLGAIGHALSPEHAHHAGSITASPTTLLSVSVAAAAGLLLLRPSGQRVLALAFVAILTVLAFETALHSVHHLDEPDAGASCPVLTATSHASGVSAPTADLDARPDLAGAIVGVDRAWLLPFCSLRVPEGRAPPVPRSA
jgi:hypothetical protein